MLSQAPFMSSFSPTFSKAAYLFVISISYCFLTSRSFCFLRLNLYPSNFCAGCLLTANLSYQVSRFLKSFVTFGNGWRSTLSSAPICFNPKERSSTHTLTKRPCGLQNWSKTQNQIEKPPFLNAIKHNFSSQPAQSLAITPTVLIKPG
jgi:hypothetical protein